MLKVFLCISTAGEAFSNGSGETWFGFVVLPAGGKHLLEKNAAIDLVLLDVFSVL